MSDENKSDIPEPVEPSDPWTKTTVTLLLLIAVPFVLFWDWAIRNGKENKQ